MREIKFRAKEFMKNPNCSEWIYGYPVRNVYASGTDWFMYIDRDSKLELLAICGDTICQYTGLKDKNGVEIYEGDIIGFEYEDEHYIVGFSDGMFVALDENGFVMEDLDEYTDGCVFGNIHDQVLEEVQK